jgi:hypothetical protein
MADDRYELRLVKIEGDRETTIDSCEAPMDDLEPEIQASELPNREAMSVVAPVASGFPLTAYPLTSAQ